MPNDGHMITHIKNDENTIYNDMRSRTKREKQIFTAHFPTFGIMHFTKLSKIHKFRNKLT